MVPLLPVALLAAAIVPQDDVDDRQLRKPAKALGAYLEARVEGVPTAKSRDRLREAARELEESAGIETLLARPDVVGRIWDLAAPLEKTRAKKGKITIETVPAAGFEDPGLRFAVRLPKRYKPRDRTHPVVLLVPPIRVAPEDAVERYLDRASDLTKEDAAYRDDAIVLCPDVPDDPLGWISVTHDGAPGGIRHVLAALRIAERRFAIDRDRVHLVGLDEGATLALAVADHRADRFAGIVAEIGEQLTLDGRPGAANFRTIPTYFTSNSVAAQEFASEIEREGYDNAWTATTWTAGGAWQWMRAHPRVAMPTEVTVRPGVSFPTRVHWLAIDSNAKDTEARAVVDREAGRIEIEARGATSITLLLNDELVDLDRALVVVVNGEKRTLSAYRDWTTTLDRILDGTSDPDRVYVAELVVPVPAVKKK